MEQEQKDSVEIPENVIETLRNQAREKAIKSTHNWKQKGGWVKCTACPYPHAIRVMPGQALTGIENNMPVIHRSR